jgi:hypothetical protein
VASAEQVSELIRYFEEHVDCVVLQVGGNVLEISLLGSYRHDRHDAMVEDLLARFRAGGSNGRQPLQTNGSGKSP